MVLTLYGYPYSTCTRRLVPIDMTKGEHKAAAFVAHQPFGQVPYIDDEGFELFESRAIARYVATKYAGQGTRVVPDPADVRATARFEQASSIELSDFDPYVSSLAWEKVFKKFSGLATDEKAVAAHLQTLSAKLDAYEVMLSKTKYLAGDEVTIADLFHLPGGAMLEPMGIDVLVSGSRPNLARWWKDISSRPSWQAVKDSA
ncbi:glutathione transferase [Amylocystis lapponica]|nr:glutathione transferase [Amylocystis lapponica]